MKHQDLKETVLYYMVITYYQFIKRYILIGAKKAVTQSNRFPKFLSQSTSIYDIIIS